METNLEISKLICINGVALPVFLVNIFKFWNIFTTHRAALAEITYSHI